MISPIDELKKMQCVVDSLTTIRSKKSVLVYRVRSKDKRFVLKIFEHLDDRREIHNYQILASLHVPIIQVFAHTDCALLLEDIEVSDEFRLGCEEDLSNVTIARRLANWYRKLHDGGMDYVASTSDTLYCENDEVTHELLCFVMERTNSPSNPFWELLFSHFDDLKRRIEAQPYTLNYNDFYYTNFVVAKDQSSAMMFDFNLLGKGFACSDIRNVTSSLSKTAAKEFMDEYGAFDASQVELDNVFSNLFTLSIALKQEQFPPWGEHSLALLKNGTLYTWLQNLPK